MGFLESDSHSSWNINASQHYFTGGSKGLVRPILNKCKSNREANELMEGEELWDESNCQMVITNIM